MPLALHGHAGIHVHGHDALCNEILFRQVGKWVVMEIYWFEILKDEARSMQTRDLLCCDVLDWAHHEITWTPLRVNDLYH